MQLAGSIIENLKAAIAAAERHQDHPVYEDTIQFWRDLLDHARATRRRTEPADPVVLDELIAHLDSQVSARRSSIVRKGGGA
jgi:predicted component of type VI protein secretion system